MTDTFEFHRQARGPGNYLALGVAMGLIYIGWAQGWPLMAVLLCGPYFAYVLVRLILNEAEGFRLLPGGIEFYRPTDSRMVVWRDLAAVTLRGDGDGGAECLLHLKGGVTETLPATAGFSPERLRQEFRSRGVNVRHHPHR